MKLRTITFLFAFLAVYKVTCEDGAEEDTTSTTPVSNAEITVGVSTTTPNQTVTLSVEECNKLKEDYQVAKKKYNEESAKYNVAMRGCRKTNTWNTTTRACTFNRTTTRKSKVTTTGPTTESSTEPTTVTPSSE